LRRLLIFEKKQVKGKVHKKKKTKEPHQKKEEERKKRERKSEVLASFVSLCSVILLLA